MCRYCYSLDMNMKNQFPFGFVRNILFNTCRTNSPGNVQTVRRRKITEINIKIPMIIDHLKLRQITYRNVFHGDVNQRKDVLGRLKLTFTTHKSRTDREMQQTLVLLEAEGLHVLFLLDFYRLLQRLAKQIRPRLFPIIEFNSSNIQCFLINALLFDYR